MRPLFDNNIIHGDNEELISQIPSESVGLIYIDPPFFTQKEQKGKVSSYSDKWKSLEEYLKYIERILKQCHRILKETGSIYIHTDYHSSHYIKVLIDEIFGYNNFLNEIVWKRAIGKTSKNKHGIEHDTILLYTKKRGKHYYKPQFKDLSEATLKRYNKKDEKGIYMEQTITAPNSDKIYDFGIGEKMPSRGRGYAWSRDKIKKEIKSGKIFKSSKGNLVFKRYLKDSKGSPVGTLWDDVHFVIKPEDTGYPTQKPIKLLERIILTSSKREDVVFDCFLGSGTTAVASKRLGRRFIGIDNNVEAIKISKERLKSTPKLVEYHKMTKYIGE